MSKSLLEKLKSTTTYTGISILDSATSLFYISTRGRIAKEMKSKNKPTFLEEVISSSTFMTVGSMELGMMILQPKLAVPVILTNASSITYEIIRDRRKKAREKREALARGVPESEFGFIADLRKSFKKFVDGTRNLPRNLKNGTMTTIRNFPRALGIYATSYAVVSSLAVGHYFLTKDLGKERFDPKDVNVRITECKLKTPNGEYKFFLGGELHLYNYSSSKFIDKFFKDNKPNVILSEGLDSTNYKFDPIESLLSSLYIPIQAGTGFDSETPRDIADKTEIPTVYLEKQSESGGIREGVSPGTKVLLGVLGTANIILAPSLYFGMIPMKHFPDTFRFPSIDREMDDSIIADPLLEGRNPKMVDRAYEYLTSHPNEVPYIRTGNAHAKGMLKLFSSKGELSYHQLRTEDVMANPSTK